MLMYAKSISTNPIDEMWIRPLHNMEVISTSCVTTYHYSVSQRFFEFYALGLQGSPPYVIDK